MAISLQEPQAVKKTPLYDRHLALGAKMAPFAGYAMPVYYSSILEEHQATRQACGFFDVSHLGELRIRGPEAFALIQRLVTSDLGALRDGQMLYGLLLDERGMTIDDILIYRENAQDYYVVVNASNIAADLDAFQREATAGARVTDASDTTACVAVQGPRAEAFLAEALGLRVGALGYYSFCAQTFGGAPVWISRSGYTGEDGFEIFCAPEAAGSVWDRLLDRASSFGARPAGLGARNTLRLEAGNALYGHEITRETTPLEAGLGWAVAFDKGDFVGREALVRQKASGLRRKLVGFTVKDRAIAREGYPIFAAGRRIGEVTSGSFAPSLGVNIGMGYVEKGFEAPETAIEIEIHGRRVPASVTKRPFVPLRHKKGSS